MPTHDSKNFTTQNIMDKDPLSTFFVMLPPAPPLPLPAAVPPRARSPRKPARLHALPPSTNDDGAVPGPQGIPTDRRLRPEFRSWRRPPGPIPSQTRKVGSQSREVRSNLRLTRPGLRAQEMGSEESRGTRPQRHLVAPWVGSPRIAEPSMVPRQWSLLPQDAFHCLGWSLQDRVRQHPLGLCLPGAHRSVPRSPMGRGIPVRRINNK